MKITMLVIIFVTNASQNRVSQPSLFIVNVATKEVDARHLPDGFFIITIIIIIIVYIIIKSSLFLSALWKPIVIIS